MKRYVLAVAAAATAVFAAAPTTAAPLIAGSQISLNGYVVGSPAGSISQATSLDFTDAMGTTGSAPGVLSSYGAGSGSFAGVACTSAPCGSIVDLASLAIGAQTINNFVTLTGGNNVNPIYFTLLGIQSITRGPNDLLQFTAYGTINWLGYDATPGSFNFTAQANSLTSFSATTVANAVPEPATWAMMLLGFGGIGFAMRRRRQPTLAQVA
ncbi:PEPxxWA-CTERM sorting domain-containing protein [Sphingomonas flavescens]|uniref:PEPxxWA-CTERM sorting domain-containing protein n=1 Tax=Sphingomonas flavescens TaxID=3132797 RepID=UPI002806009D|nr:PEPxxWA-CTERM sorting domain-containing protein [Sphingomonas limnosediminicola]